MAKTRTVFECQQCGAQSPKWLGRCPDCGAWGSLAEVRREAAPAPGAYAGLATSAEVAPLAEVEGGAESRWPSGLPELDRVLGGGIVAGSAVLVGGDPGIGKSTLLLQLLQAQARSGRKVLYVTGEESARQIRMRADRLGGPPPGLYVLSETDLGRVLEAVDRVGPEILVADSVQTLYSPEIGSAPGTVSQVREVSGRLAVLAKGRGVPVFLVGHVTKEGALAGPRLLEHMVDTVLYFEGDRGHPYRILRAVKNRFGSTNEVGVFEMGEAGLQGVANPSALFLAERPRDAAGSAVVPCLEGTRTLLVEVQALVAPSTFAAPQRTTSGVERNRVQILAALLERRLGLPLAAHDIFVNVAGGLRVAEPAVDLAVVAALISAFRDRPLPSDAVFFGEVGLAGEVRGVSRADARLAEARELGFGRAFVPLPAARHLHGAVAIELIGVPSVADLLDRLG
ncbi:MAG: DNA repair protein RadA [Deltaproteobacteria bacterium]|nr:DNA repair protein RadA [Deltaproteobacteria bacterium]